MVVGDDGAVEVVVQPVHAFGDVLRKVDRLVVVQDDFVLLVEQTEQGAEWEELADQDQVRQAGASSQNRQDVRRVEDSRRQARGSGHFDQQL